LGGNRVLDEFLIIPLKDFSVPGSGIKPWATFRGFDFAAHIFTP